MLSGTRIQLGQGCLVRHLHLRLHPYSIFANPMQSEKAGACSLLENGRGFSAFPAACYGRFNFLSRIRCMIT